MRSIRTQIAVVGGGTGGTAAALALGARGVSCVVLEPTDWIGGQLTSQAVPPDENRWIEGRQGVQSATQSYLSFRQKVRAWYRQNRRLIPVAYANEALNPGNGWVSDLCHEPAVGHAVLQDMVAPYIAAGTVSVHTECRLVRVETAADRISAVVVRDRDGNELTVEADYFLDATEFGDLLLLGGVEHLVGAEHTSVHGELHGRPDKTDPTDIQAVSWCFAIEHRPGENHVIDRPASYAFWRDWTPPLTPPWPGKLLSWTQVGGEEHKPREFRFLPWPQEPDAGEWEMWRYRRIVDRALYADGQNHPDVALINMVQMDYYLKPTLPTLAEGGIDHRDAVLQEAKELSRCFLYWMQTDAPRFDGSGKTGFPGLKLRGDELGTADGFAKHVYVREARRLEALTVVSERHVGMQQRRAEGLVRAGEPPHGVGECFEDSVGIGHYRLDLHPSSAMRNSLYVEAAPFRIPLSALIPKRVTNLIAAGKCLGVSHIANGCYRLHPVEWNVGESAGHLAAYCLREKVSLRAVLEKPRLRAFQAELVRAGVALAWPWEDGVGLS